MEKLHLTGLITDTLSQASAFSGFRTSIMASDSSKNSIHFETLFSKLPKLPKLKETTENTEAHLSWLNRSINLRPQYFAQKFDLGTKKAQMWRKLKEQVIVIGGEREGRMRFYFDNYFTFDKMR